MKLPKVILSCLIAFSPALTITSYSQSESLLPDGSFENVDSSNRVAGWPGGQSLSWEMEGDNRFLRIESSGGERMDSLFMKVPVPDGVQALELSYRGRVTDLTRGELPHHDARVIINFKDEAGNRISSPPPPYHRSSTDGWVKKTSRFLVPEEAISLDFMPTLFHAKSGTFDLDDIKLVSIDAKALRKERERNAPPPVPDLEDVEKELAERDHRCGESASGQGRQ